MPETMSPDRPSERAGRITVTLAGLVAAVLWCGVYLFVLAPAPTGALALVGQAFYFLLPLVLISAATYLAHQVQELRAEAARLRAQLQLARQAADRTGIEHPDRTGPAPSGAKLPALEPKHPTGSSGRETIVRRTSAAPTPASAMQVRANWTQPTRANGRDAQPDLPLEPADRDDPDLTLPDLIRALHFPETADDTAGLRALDRALRHHKAGLVVQAAQDMLTLLSQDGIYVDDLEPGEVESALWRRFTSGERNEETMAVGAITDADALRRCAEQLQSNTVYRDTAHHFLRRFDRMLDAMIPDISDEAIDALTATRSARAFMLVGRAAGMFDRT
jgi:hypothetical protein